MRQIRSLRTIGVLGLGTSLSDSLPPSTYCLPICLDNTIYYRTIKPAYLYIGLQPYIHYHPTQPLLPREEISTMVSATSRRLAATPLVLLLLSSAVTVNAQYTLRGRVVNDNHKNSLGRRAEPIARAEATGAGDTNQPGGEDDGPAVAEASSSTHSDKGDEGHAISAKEGDGGRDASGDENEGNGDNQSPVCHGVNQRPS